MELVFGGRDEIENVVELGERSPVKIFLPNAGF